MRMLDREAQWTILQVSIGISVSLVEMVHVMSALKILLNSAFAFWMELSEFTRS